MSPFDLDLFGQPLTSDDLPRSVPLVRILTVQETHVSQPLLSRAEFVVDFWRQTMPFTPLWDEAREWMVVFVLNRRNRLIAWNIVSMGTATNALVHPREVFRPVLAVGGATGCILAHNHPSGDTSPSTADLQVTRQLRDAAKVLSVDLLDHVIIGRPSHDPSGQGYYSFRAAGVL